MKKILVLFLCVFYAYQIFAQDTTQVKLADKNPKFNLSGFGGILSETSFFGKNVTESLGAGGALLINNYFFVGGYAMGMASNIYIDDLVMPEEPDSLLYMGTKLRINYSHAGFWVGGIFFPNKIVHFGVSTRLGWGHIYLTDKYNTSYINNENYKLDYTNDKVFVISPQIELEIKVTSWLKFNMGFGYNFVTGIDFYRYKGYNFNKPEITVGIYFGGFSSKPEEETQEEGPSE